MGDMAQDFITVTARAAELERQNREQAYTIDNLEARVSGLITMRNDLQRANSDYLEQARKNREADRANIDGWRSEAEAWANKFATYRQEVEEYHRDMAIWFKGMRGYGQLGFILDLVFAAFFFAAAFGFVGPIINLRWW